LQIPYLSHLFLAADATVRNVPESDCCEYGRNRKWLDIRWRIRLELETNNVMAVLSLSMLLMCMQGRSQDFTVVWGTQAERRRPKGAGIGEGYPPPQVWGTP